MGPIVNLCIDWGFSVLTAKNGAEAIESFLTESPDLIFMDSVMPIMDGYEATTRIKALCKNRWLPIILVMKSNNDQDLSRGIATGVDDYLFPPVSPLLLRERILLLHRVAEMERVLNKNLKDVEEYRDIAQEEERLARQIIERVIRYDEIRGKNIQYWMLPAKNMSGDIVTATRAGYNKLYVMLADAAGHGLHASLMAMLIAQIFYDMAERGVSIASIAEELNWRIHKQMPANNFAAATLVSIDTYRRSIEIWNGGNPPLLFVNHQGNIVAGWGSMHLPLGILNRERFNAKAELFRWDEPGQLVLCSDGFLEAEDVDGRTFGWNRLLQVVSSVPIERCFASLVEAIQAHLGGKLAHDDISLVAIHCYSEDLFHKTNSHAEKGIKASEETIPWNLKIGLGPEKLKSFHLLPLLLDWLNLMDIRKAHNASIYLILSELYYNALDHGILHLDSNLKLQPGGFEYYMQQRIARLSTLTEGYIEIDMGQVNMGQVKINGRQMLRIHVKDSGPGFDHSKVVDTDKTNGIWPCAYGIRLIKNLCSEVEYRGSGNEVIVHYQL